MRVRASMPAIAPRSVRVLFTETCSLYVPAATFMVSPGEAALIAAWIDEKHPPEPEVFTQSVANGAGAAGPDPVATNGPERNIEAADNNSKLLAIRFRWLSLVTDSRIIPPRM